MAKVTPHRRAYGQFFTPEPVVACCYALLAGLLPAAPQIVDPACGDGAFLRHAAAHALAPPERITGCELDPALASTLADSLPLVHHADGLDPASLPDSSFDLVIGNPPYGVAASPHGDTSLASELRFLLRALDLARPGGLVALVLPSGVLANERLRAARAGLLERSSLLAVIALPRSTFRHAGTYAACSILVLRNQPAAPDHQVFFAIPPQLDDLPATVAAYQAGVQLETPHPLTPIPQHSSSLPWAFQLAQTPALARRMDAHYLRPGHAALLEQLAAQGPLRPLGQLLDRRLSLIPGDHVRPSRGEAKGPGLPYEYYQTREFMPAGYNYAAVERCDELAYRRLRHSAVRQHDILVSCAGVGGAGRGRVCLVTHEPGPSCTGDVFILRVQRPNPIFLYMFLRSPAGRAQLLQLQNGVGTTNISAAELLQVRVPLLPAADQDAFAACYEPIATAHGTAMAALHGGKQSDFERERLRAEQLLAALQQQLAQILKLEG